MLLGSLFFLDGTKHKSLRSGFNTGAENYFLRPEIMRGPGISVFVCVCIILSVSYSTKEGVVAQAWEEQFFNAWWRRYS